MSSLKEMSIDISEVESRLSRVTSKSRNEFLGRLISEFEFTSEWQKDMLFKMICLLDVDYLLKVEARQRLDSRIVQKSPDKESRLFSRLVVRPRPVPDKPGSLN